MKIVNTFLFSEPHESTLLYLKLLLESPMVNEFILIENSYDFKGNYKGVFAENILKDEKFLPFRDKIKIVTLDQRLTGGSAEKENFERENWQRTSPHDYICDNFNNEDLVLISDTDEMFDFTDSQRVAKFCDITFNNPDKIVRIGRQRYWYDFDNMCFYPKFTIPVVPVKYLRSDKKHWKSRHQDDNSYYCGNNPIAFEYSYCFANLEQLMRKKNTYSHTGFTEDDVKRALRVNSWVRSPNRGETTGNCKWDYFEFVKLTNDNSPAYVRSHLQELKTNLVDPNYKINRVKNK